MNGLSNFSIAKWKEIDGGNMLLEGKILYNFCKNKKDDTYTMKIRNVFKKIAGYQNINYNLLFFK